MVNEDYEPTDIEDDIVDVFMEEWRVNPYLIREKTDYGKETVNTALSNLSSAGWIRKVTRGLYEFVEDPRSGRTGWSPEQVRAAGEIDEEVEETDPEEISEIIEEVTEPVDSGELAMSDTTDPIEDALTGWSYGQTDDEQGANTSVARASLEWLRETGDTVRQSDVPLDELAEDDPQDRQPDTLWRSVIRDAWQHAVGQGYVEKPDSRGYKWLGDE